MRKAMNYNEFMKAVDNKLSGMSEMEKNEWIHNMARTTKEHERIAFLNSLNENQDYNPVISEKKKWVEEWCRKIENGEIYFECSGYEEYRESYWDSDFTYDFYDVFGIGKDLLKAFQVAEDLLFQKEYEPASALYDCLCSKSFSLLDRHTEEWSDLELEELVEEKLVDLDLNQIALNLMYAKYQIAKGEDRTAALYRYLTWHMCKNISVEEIFTVGPEELKGIDSFMEEWITFLKNKSEDRAGDLLLEACLYQGGVARLCEVAKEVWVSHPVLYKYACEHLLNEKKERECVKLGLEAIRILPETLIIRGKIADLTAKAAERLEQIDVMQECYEAAFYSEATLSNFLRLFELSDYRNIADRAAKYAKTLPENSMLGFPYKNKQMMVNSLSKENKNVIRFFNGEFEYIHKICKNDKTTLGWSSQFKGIAVPLFILLLTKNEELTKAKQQLINGIVYRLNLEANTEIFSKRFLSWKEKVMLTNEQLEKYMEWLEEEVNKRTEAVVGGGYRKSYYKAAIIIAALGEALESNGMANGRNIMIERYKKLYSRKRAFKAEFEMLKD